MKKSINKIAVSVIALLLVLPTVMSFASCIDQSREDDRELKIVCSIFPQYDFCRVITGSDKNITLLQKNGTDMHSYEPTSADILKVAESDLLVYTGGSSDGWVDGVLRAAGGDVKKFDLFSHSDLLCEQNGHSDEHGHLHGEDGDCGIYDEHVWMSIENSINIVRGLCDTICEIDPESAEKYRANTEAYILELEALSEEFRSLCEGKTIVVADRFPLLYFCRENGIEYYAAFPGCSAEVGASFETVTSLIKTVKDGKISTIFKVDGSSGETAQAVAKDTGATVKELYSCQSVTDAQFSSGESYLSMMRKNLETLKEAWS